MEDETDNTEWRQSVVDVCGEAVALAIEAKYPDPYAAALAFVLTYCRALGTDPEIPNASDFKKYFDDVKRDYADEIAEHGIDIEWDGQASTTARRVGRERLRLATQIIRKRLR